MNWNQGEGLYTEGGGLYRGVLYMDRILHQLTYTKYSIYC